MIIKEEHITRNIDATFNFLVVIFPVTLLLKNSYSNVVLIILIAAFIIGSKRTCDRNRFMLVVLPLAYFGIHLLGLTYSENVESGLAQIERSLTFIVWPLMFCWKGNINGRVVQSSGRAFTIGVVVASLYCLVLGFWRLLTKVHVGNVQASELSYTNLTDPLHIHPTYFSLFVVLALSFLLTFERGIFKRLAVFFLVLIALLLAVRIAIVALIFIAAFQVRTLDIKLKRIVQISAFSLLIITVLVLSSPLAFQRFVADFSQSDGEKLTGVNMRVFHWKASLAVLKDHYLIGVGTGDEQHALDQQYCKFGLNELKDFNSHNQYLFDMIGTGIAGLCILLCLLIVPLRFYRHSSNHIAMLFMVTITVYCMTECLLVVNKGLMFFSFFYSLLSFCGEKDLIKNEYKHDYY
jgi:O-antigen ligase